MKGVSVLMAEVKENQVNCLNFILNLMIQLPVWANIYNIEHGEHDQNESWYGKNMLRKSKGSLVFKKFLFSFFLKTDL